MKLQYLLSIILLLFLATSCEKENELSEYEQMWLQLRKSDNVDPQSIFTQLTGEWKMIATACGHCLSPGVKATNKNVKLVFTTDSTLRVFENGQLIRSSKFTIKPEPGYTQTYAIETDPLLDNLYTWGYVVIFEDKVGFITSDRDGIDYFFQRVTSSNEINRIGVNAYPIDL